LEVLELGNIKIEFDSKLNREFYSQQKSFCCECQDCLNYVDKLQVVKNLMNGLDEKLGIDLSKDVGQGMDELYPHDREGHHLYVIPYYINGICTINNKKLGVKQEYGQVLSNTIRTEYKLDQKLTLTIVNTSKHLDFGNSKNILTIWLEFKTPLI